MGEYDEFYITRCRDPNCNELFKSRQYRLSHERKEHDGIYTGEHGFTVFFPNKQERDKEFDRLSELLSNSRRTEIAIMKDDIQKERETIIMKKAQEQAALRAQGPEVKPPIQQTQEIIYEAKPEVTPPEVKKPKPVEQLIIEKKVEDERTAVNQVFKPTEKSLKKENQSFLDEFNAYFEGDEF